MTKTSKPTRASPTRSAVRPPTRRAIKRRPPRKADPPPHVALVAFAKLAKRLGLRWYLFGAQAVNLYGFPRSTVDVDVTIALGERTSAGLVARLRKSGFTPRFDDAAFITAARVIPVVHDATAVPIDLVLAGEGIEQRFLSEVVPANVGGVEIPVLSPENLVVTKVLAGRPKDLEDVRELIAIRELDHAKIEALLELLDKALDQDDLRSLYRRLRG